MDLGPLALVVGAGLVGPVLASAHRFSPPVVVGQIAAGVVIGVTGFGWVDPAEPFLNGLAMVGFALLMFVVGTHLPIRDERLRTVAVPGLLVALTVAGLAAAAALAIAAATGLHRPGMLAVVLATSSGAVALPVLQSIGPPDRSALVLTVWIAAADVGTVLALPLALAQGNVVRVLLGAAVVIGVGVTMYVVARLGSGRAVVLRARQLSHERGWGLDLRVSLLALFTTAWLAAHYGASILIAGFTVGVVVAMLGEPRRVADQLIGVGEGFAIPLFFVHLGAQLDLRTLWHESDVIWLAGLLGVAAVVIHVVAAMIWRLPIGAGLLASAQLGVPSAAVSVGLSSGQLTPAQAAAIMTSVLVTLGACAIGGVALGHSGPLTDASAPG